MRRKHDQIVLRGKEYTHKSKENVKEKIFKKKIKTNKQTKRKQTT